MYEVHKVWRIIYSAQVFSVIQCELSVHAYDKDIGTMFESVYIYMQFVYFNNKYE